MRALNKSRLQQRWRFEMAFQFEVYKIRERLIVEEYSLTTVHNNALADMAGRLIYSQLLVR